MLGKGKVPQSLIEAVQKIQEYEAKDGKFVHKARPGSYGGSAQEPRSAFDVLSGPKKKDIEKMEKKPVKKEEVELGEGTESAAEHHDRMHRLADLYHSMSGDKKASLSKIPGRAEAFKRAVEYAKANPNMKKEEVESIDELSKKTLGSYAKKATDDVSYHSFDAGQRSDRDPERLKTDKKAMSRQAGVNKAIDRLAKEDTDDCVTPAQAKKIADKEVGKHE
jgi:hypothetical protein